MGGKSCTCHTIKKSLSRYRSAGLPKRFEKITAPEALKLSGRPATDLKKLRAAGKASTLSPSKLIVLAPSNPTPFPMACWIARNMAVKRDIIAVTISDIISDLFDNRGMLGRRVCREDVGVIFRLGIDPGGHKFIPSKLTEIVKSRLDSQSPTIICYDSSPTYNYEVVYGRDALFLIRDNGITL